MMTKTNIYTLIPLLIGCLLLGFAPATVFGQNTLDSRIDSNCILHVRLLDSTGAVVNNQAPYLLQVNQLQFNSNAVAIWQVDLSNAPSNTHTITITDRNLFQYSGNISSTCNSSSSSVLPLNTPSIVPSSSCTACSGSALVSAANSGLYTFRWSDGFTDTDTLRSSRANLCAGTYTVVVSDSLGNHNSVEFDILCGASNVITCVPTITRYLDANGQASIRIDSVRTGGNLTANRSYFIDPQGHFSTHYNLDCSDIGYQYLTLFAQDTTTALSDTCQVLVRVIDTLRYCGAYSNTIQIVDSSGNATSCNTCNGFYEFTYLINPVTGDTTFRNALNFYWSDTASNSGLRFNLCPNVPYEVTVVDVHNNSYQYTVNVGCPNNTCIDTTTIPPQSYCPSAIIPVCGCNGITYRNACVAEYEAGVQSWTLGGCNTALQLRVTTRPDASACDSAAILGSGAITVQATGGTGNITYNWNTGQVGRVLDSLFAGIYIVTVTDNGTGNQLTRLITVGTQGCVWPGDADDNGVANNFDLLPIGLAYGNTGPARAFVSTAWQGYTAPTWQPFNIPLLANGRHIDCNGDGAIDSVDVQAIQQNYGRSYARNGGNSLLGTIPFYVESGQGAAGDSVRTNIILGDSVNPATNVYGVAFTIHYNPDHLENDPVQIDFSNSWLGNSLIHVQKDIRRAGQMEVAVSRTNQLPITGSGPIGAVSFTIKDDLVMGKLAGDSVVSPLGIANVRLIDAQNQVIGTNPRTGNLILNEQIAIHKLPQAAGISIYPNPVRDMLYLKSKTAHLEQVQLFTATGQLVHQQTLHHLQQHSISTERLPEGLYLLQLQTSEGVFSQKVQVVH
jgi:hypothetical protein